VKYSAILFRWTLRHRHFADNNIKKETVLCNESLNSLADCERKNNIKRDSKLFLNAVSSKQ